MLIKRQTLDAIAAGSIRIQFRRWRRPTVKSGGTLRTAVGVLAIDAIVAVSESALSDADARAAGFASRAALLRELRGRGEGTPYRIDLRYLGPDPLTALRKDDALDREALNDIVAALDRLDSRSRNDAWTLETLRLIARHPGTRAEALAGMRGMSRPAFKRDVRKLKTLGLTESLDVGYRLSPRGAAVLARLDVRREKKKAPRPGGLLGREEGGAQ